MYSRARSSKVHTPGHCHGFTTVELELTHMGEVKHKVNKNRNKKILIRRRTTRLARSTTRSHGFEADVARFTCTSCPTHTHESDEQARHQHRRGSGASIHVPRQEDGANEYVVNTQYTDPSRHPNWLCPQWHAEAEAMDCEDVRLRSAAHCNRSARRTMEKISLAGEGP